MAQPANPTPSQLGWMLLLCGAITTVLWMESLERYLGARYHLNIEPMVPAQLYVPSRVLARWTALLRPSDSQAAGTDKANPAEPGPGADVAGPRAAAAAVAASAAPTVAPKLDAKAAPTVAPNAALTVTPKAAPTIAPQVAPTVPPRATATLASMPLLASDAKPGEFLPSLVQQKLATGPQRILFAGDSLMQGVAPLVIRDLTRRHPDWKMQDLSRQSTGLTVKRYFDWPVRIQEEIKARNLTLVVVFLGPNDPWDLYLPGKRIAFPSAEWEQYYGERVDEVLAHATAQGVRVIWIGLPSMGDGRVRTGAVIQNRAFYRQTLARQTDYLSTEALLGPLSLPFQRTYGGPDAPPVSLRAGDGIHFSQAGLEKIRQALLDHIEKGAQP